MIILDEEAFKSYYYNYMGILIKDLKKGRTIFSCNQRKKPINSAYFQPLIITKIDDINIFSISPEFYEEFANYIEFYKNIEFEELLSVTKIYFEQRLEKYSIRKMYRMVLDHVSEEFLVPDNVVKVTKEILMKNIESASSQDKDQIWKRKKDEILEGRQYAILDGHKIVSYCKVSDIDYGGGNLTVYTNENHRGKGYGKATALGAISWCIENQIISVYWVDEKNMASIALAKSLGFKVIAEEIVVGTSAP